MRAGKIRGECRRKIKEEINERKVKEENKERKIKEEINERKVKKIEKGKQRN